MARYFYVDRVGTLTKCERTPQGGYRAQARIARAGVLPYTADSMEKQGLVLPEHLKGKTVRIFTRPEVLQAACDSMRDAPVTREHPPKFVDPTNYSKYAAGTVSAATVNFDGEFLTGTILIQDETLIHDVEKGFRREVSAGYSSGIVFEDGVDAVHGAYDAVRIDIKYNHAAIVSRGRAGAQVCLALDSDEIPGESPVKIKVRGVEYEVDAVQSAIDRLEGELVAAQETVRTSQEARTAAETALTAKAEEVRLATCDSALDALLEKRTAEAKAKEEKEKRLAAVKKAYPSLVEDSRLQSADFVDGLFLAIPQDNGVNALLGQAGNSAAGSERQDQDPSVPQKTARERMLERNKSMARPAPADK